MGRMISNLLDYTLEVFGNEETLPKLNFHLNFNGFKCVSSPSVSEICDQYDSFFKLVSRDPTMYIY